MMSAGTKLSQQAKTQSQSCARRRVVRVALSTASNSKCIRQVQTASLVDGANTLGAGMTLEQGPFVFRVNENGTGPNLLIQVCMERGWRECSYTNATDNWNLWWKTSAFPVSQHKHLKAWQFTNHIPKGASICRKDNLARYLKCMKKVYGAIYDITPHGYNLPLEYTKLVADCSRQGEEEQRIWICKPVGQSQGRGIFLFRDLSDLCYDSNAVVQRYIMNPLLIGGYKFDLRLYVCVPSYHPLTIYLYKEGIVRFSTDKFSLNDLSNPFCHLTNSSLNKLGPGYADQKGGIGAGCKWSLRQLRHHFEQTAIRDWLLWQRITSLVTLTILSQSTSVPSTTNCFEFYGFDVLVDENLKPWLLEVNLSPALGHDCDVDPAVKKPLLHDLFDLLGLPVCNTGLSLFTTFDDNSRPQSVCASRPEGSDTSSDSTEKCGLGMLQKPFAASAMVATAATKWRRKRKSGYLFGPPRRTNVDQQIPKPLETQKNQHSENRRGSDCRSKKNGSQTNLYKAESIKVNAVTEDRQSKQKKQSKTCETMLKPSLLPFDKSYLANKGFRGRIKTSPPQLWGNGRDWRSPTDSEGDWGRIYPFSTVAGVSTSEDIAGEKQIKNVVQNVSRFSRGAKQVFSNYSQASDHQLNKNLINNLGLTGDVWLPPK